MLAQTVPNGVHESSSASIFACGETGHERWALDPWSVPIAQGNTRSLDLHAWLNVSVPVLL
jgi:hypothetical protein